MMLSWDNFYHVILLIHSIVGNYHRITNQMMVFFLRITHDPNDNLPQATPVRSLASHYQASKTTPRVNKICEKQNKEAWIHRIRAVGTLFPVLI